jgi:FMN reductase
MPVGSAVPRAVSRTLAIVVGNPKPRSRTRQLADAVAARVISTTGARHTLTVDLCDYADDLFKWPHDGLAEVSRSVAAADLLIVASPTYKASYTGLLKAFLDRYPHRGLTGTTAVPVMMAGDPTHGLAVETALRPLLVELGASLPTLGLCVLTSQLDRMDEILNEWAANNLANAPVLGPVKRTADK